MVLRAAEQEKGFVYWLDERSRRDKAAADKELIYHRRYVCPDCVFNLFGEFVQDT
jgi:hypothetical protein